MSKILPICVIAPSKRLMEKAEIVTKRLGQKIDIRYITLDKTLDCVNALMKSGTEIFISRAGSLALIRQATKAVTVEIQANLSDYIEIMEIAKKANGPIAFFSYGETSDDMKTMCRLLKLQIAWYDFKTEKSAEECVLKAIRDGAVLGIGGAFTEIAAQEHGLPYLPVESSEDAILLAIKEANHILSVQQQEQKKQAELKLRLRRYQMVMDYTHDAIISINSAGYIDVVNQTAGKLLKTDPKLLLGQHVQEVIPKSSMLKTLNGGYVITDQLLRFGSVTVDSNYAPILVDGEVRGVVATFQDIKQIQSREQKIRIDLHEKGLTAKYHFANIVGQSSQIQSAIQAAQSYAPTDATVLILGESGTGKELFAQSIHNASERKKQPFVAINCAALDKNLLESELFGYVEGSFTGARKGGKIGLFELAHTGTLFLDEIGEIPVELQAKLLRVLQEKEVHRIGGDKVIPVDVRIIAATNKNLRAEIANGNFREDLFYRLDILNLNIPPLRARENDVELIANSLYREFVPDNDPILKEKFLYALERVREYTWPGNIRELRNFCERIIIVIRNSGTTQSLDMLIEQLMGNNVWLNAKDSVRYTEPEPHIVSKSKMEYGEILRALKRNRGKIAQTAKDLGMGRTTLYRKIKQYGIQIE